MKNGCVYLSQNKWKITGHEAPKDMSVKVLQNNHLLEKKRSIFYVYSIRVLAVSYSDAKIHLQNGSSIIELSARTLNRWMLRQTLSDSERSVQASVPRDWQSTFSSDGVDSSELVVWSTSVHETDIVNG